MNLGKILGSISPGFGMLSGKGAFGNAGGILGSLSPLLGMLLGKGVFGHIGGGHSKGGDPSLSSGVQTNPGYQEPDHPIAPEYVNQLLQKLMG